MIELLSKTIVDKNNSISIYRVNSDLFNTLYEAAEYMSERSVVLNEQGCFYEYDDKLAELTDGYDDIETYITEEIKDLCTDNMIVKNVLFIGNDVIVIHEEAVN